MNLTLDEVVAQQDRLRQEIMERQCLLAAFDVMHGYMAEGGKVARSAELSPLISAFATPAPPPAALDLPPLAPANLPAPPPPVERYVHPELKALPTYNGYNGKLVWWAIQRMTDDYSLHDIASLLDREGARLGNPRISVVLTRLKARGQIKEVRPAAGPHPALFCKPENALPVVPAPEETAANPEASVLPVALS
jgi:hypothetical protein